MPARGLAAALVSRVLSGLGAKLLVSAILSLLPLAATFAFAFNYGVLDGLGLIDGVQYFVNAVPLNVSDVWHGLPNMIIVTLLIPITLIGVFSLFVPLFAPWLHYGSRWARMKKHTFLKTQEKRSKAGGKEHRKRAKAWVRPLLCTLISASLVAFVINLGPLVFGYSNGPLQLVTYLSGISLGIFALSALTSPTYDYYFGQRGKKLQRLRPALLILTALTTLMGFSVSSGIQTGMKFRSTPRNVEIESEERVVRIAHVLARLENGRISIEQSPTKLIFHDFASNERLKFPLTALSEKVVKRNSFQKILCFVYIELNGCASEIRELKYLKRERA
jgi:hypothetical protein